MDRAELREFARRDWGRVARHKQARWLNRVSGMTPAQCLELGDELRAQARTARPDWPTGASRAADLTSHLRLAELLRRGATVRG